MPIRAEATRGTRGAQQVRRIRGLSPSAKRPRFRGSLRPRGNTEIGEIVTLGGSAADTDGTRVEARAATSAGATGDLIADLFMRLLAS